MRRGLLPSLLSILPMAAGVCVRLDQVCASPREYSCPEMFPSPCQDGFLRDDTTSADFCCSYMAPHEFAVPTYTPCDTRCSPCNSDECPAADRTHNRSARAHEARPPFASTAAISVVLRVVTITHTVRSRTATPTAVGCSPWKEVVRPHARARKAAARFFSEGLGRSAHLPLRQSAVEVEGRYPTTPVIFSTCT